MKRVRLALGVAAVGAADSGAALAASADPPLGLALRLYLAVAR